MASHLTASRLLAAILLANLVTLSALNALRAPTGWLLAYPLVVGLLWRCLKPRSIRRPQTVLPRAAWWLAGFTVVLLCVPRLPYLLEWIPDNTVLAQADDHGRLAELVSLTASPHFPPLHPGNQEFLLSHYFAALLPMAWLKLAIPVLTLKDCILFGNIGYHALMLLCLLEFARHTMPTPRRALALVFLATVFSGLDWMADWRLPFSHSEHWARSALGALREVSGFYTAHYWVVHHMAALWALVLALLLVTRTRFGTRRSRNLIAGALVAAGAVHSPFVFLGAVACFPREFCRMALRCLRDGTAVVLLAVVLPVVPFFTGRLQTRSLWWHPVPAGVAAYLMGVIVVELAGLPLLVASAWRRIPAALRWAAGAAAAFLLLTYGVESVGYNNFAMRGLLAPCLVLYWLVARYAQLKLARGWVAALLVLVSLGTLREAVWLTYQPLQYSLWYWKARGLPVPGAAAAAVRPEYGRLARDRSVRFYTPGPHDRTGLNRFNAEKMVAGTPVEVMDEAELELARRSLWGW